MDTGSIPCGSTMWTLLVMDLKRVFLWDSDYKNNPYRFLNHRNTFTFWVSLCSFLWLDRNDNHQRPVERLFLASFPVCSRWRSMDPDPCRDYINHNKSLVSNRVDPFSWHLNDWDCAVFTLSLPTGCIEKEQIPPCPFPPVTFVNSFQCFYF